MTILITGASGFVGSFLALKFSKQKKKNIINQQKKKVCYKQQPYKTS